MFAVVNVTKASRLILTGYILGAIACDAGSFWGMGGTKRPVIPQLDPYHMDANSTQLDSTIGLKDCFLV